MRIIRHAGLGLLAFALLLTAGISLKTLENLNSYQSEIIVPIALIILFAVDFQRKDKMFLSRTFGNKKKLFLLHFTEYLLLLSPLLIYQLFLKNWWISGSLVFVSVLTGLLSPLLKIKLPRNTKHNVDFLPLQVFELKFAFEKQPFLFILFLSIGFISFVHVAFFVISTILVSLLLLETFKHNETAIMIHWHKRFVRWKIIHNLKYIILPFFVSGSIALISNWNANLIVLYYLIYLMVVCAMAISYKYAHFNPLLPGINNNNLLSIFIIISAIPGGIIIAFPYMLYQYLKAERNLIQIYAKNKKAPVWF